jgi:hypothetical protein
MVKYKAQLPLVLNTVLEVMQQLGKKKKEKESVLAHFVLL